jgi:Family of unknown function (DUF6444)
MVEDMSDASTPPGIDAADWAATPQTVRILVVALQQQVVTLSERVSALEERARRRSRNSSQPPSADPPSTPSRQVAPMAGCCAWSLARQSLARGLPGDAPALE